MTFKKRCSSVAEHPADKRDGQPGTKSSLLLNGIEKEAHFNYTCRCSSVAEHFLGKEEVKGSIPFNGSKIFEMLKRS